MSAPRDTPAADETTHAETLESIVDDIVACADEADGGKVDARAWCDVLIREVQAPFLTREQRLVAALRAVEGSWGTRAHVGGCECGGVNERTGLSCAQTTALVRAALTDTPEGRYQMENASSPVPKDHPLMQAWAAYKATEEYANTKRWAGHDDQATDGSLWAAFERGWMAAGGQPPAEGK